MRFWDSSALVPLAVDEPHTRAMRALAERQPELIVWWASPVECASAFHRLRREGVFDQGRTQRALAVLADLLEGAHRVLPTEDVARRAMRLLAIHPLRAADALQLAAALVWCRDRPARAEFVCLDARLREAAAAEGLRLLPEETGA